MPDISCFSWQHFVLFPRGYMEYLPGKSDGPKAVPTFLRFVEPDCDNITRAISSAKDANFAFEDGAGGYDKSLYHHIRSTKPNLPVEIRMRNACIHTRETLEQALARHVDYAGSSEDTLEQCILYASFCYGWDRNTKDIPDELRGFWQNGTISPDVLTGACFESAFMQEGMQPKYVGVSWENGKFGPFAVRKRGRYYDAYHEHAPFPIMRNFIFELEAKLHVEALYEFYLVHKDREFLDWVMSPLDFVFFDTFPASSGGTADPVEEEKKEEEDGDGGEE